MADFNELVAIVDEEDKIIGKARRGTVHEKGLLHREVYVFLVSPKRRKVLLQRRADDGKWTASAGGHFSIQEDYLEAAQREFQEELGISLPSKFFRELCFGRIKTQYKEDINDRFAKSFLVRKDVQLSAFHIDKEEVAEVRYFGNREVYSLIKESAWITRAAREILKEYIMHEIR